MRKIVEKKGNFWDFLLKTQRLGIKDYERCEWGVKNKKGLYFLFIKVSPFIPNLIMSSSTGHLFFFIYRKIPSTARISQVTGLKRIDKKIAMSVTPK